MVATKNYTKLDVDRPRIGKIAWLPEITHEWVEKVNTRIRDMSRLITKTGEPLQTSNYGVGGYFFTHCDYVDPKVIRMNSFLSV